ncbi:AraC family transcriptional regulator N-terminal domain-containing protein [Pokkaliibacter sp. CJK22405]|uniref:AraC family transcriptional regulator n=1 Tax=Pokkaliibacter sp. CJK22405 TaxID=3384615 RepID=UPI0039851942
MVAELTLKTLAEQLAPEEGYNLTALPSLRLLRSNRPLTHTPVLYDPGIVFVFQGCKRGYWGDDCYVYGEGQFLAVTLPIPFSMETEASAQEPLLALYCQLDIPLAATILAKMERAQQHLSAGQDVSVAIEAMPVASAMMASTMDAALSASLERLLRVLLDPMEARMLGEAALAEVYYRVLCGEQRRQLQQAMVQHSHFGRIAQVLEHIHHHYAEALEVTTLASLVGMSEPSFYQHFKSVTRYSPMQYVKMTRLHQARLLMLHERMSAAQASHAVGYESPSQFSREFRRLFGLAPRQEAERLRSAYALPPKEEPQRYVASH